MPRYLRLLLMICGLALVDFAAWPLSFFRFMVVTVGTIILINVAAADGEG